MPVKPSAERRRLIFWFALLLLAVVMALSFYTTARLISANAVVQDQQETLGELDQTLSHLKDVETGARGYVITGNRRYLAPFRSGTANVARGVERLKTLARGDVEMERHVRELERLTRRRVELAAATVARRSEGQANGSIIAGIETSKATMDQIRREYASLASAERAELQRQRREAEHLARTINWVLGISALLILSIMAVLMVIGNREASRRKKAEDELRELNSELESIVAARTQEVEQARSLLHAIIENMPDTVFLKDAADEFRYVLVNEAAEKLVGKERDELLGHVDHELFPPAEATLCRREDQEVNASGQAKVTPERQLTTEHGQRVIESRKVPLRFDDDEKRYVLGIVRDVTEQRSLEKQVREMQRMEAVGRLTGGVAHDFNNILAIIIGSTEMVREQVSDDTELLAIADEALNAAQGGAELVRRLLAFARKQHLEPCTVDLNERLPNVIPLLQRTLGEAISLDVRTGEDLWPALIDPTQADDALVNLAINARDAMPNGGSLTIETSNTVLDEDYASHHVEVTPGDYVMLAVSDTGIGMGPETLQRAFEPFFTTKPEGRGTGLGLSQVYGWVKQSGGHIKLYSEPDHGTTVKLYLPRAATGAQGNREPGDIEPSVTGHETILVVEDNSSVRRTVVRQLGALGYETIEAEDALSALDIIGSKVSFDLLLTDVVMPGGMTGYDLAEKAEKIRPGLKVLFTSGYTELSESRRQAPRRGMLLSKPYRKSELGRAIRSVLDES